MKRKTKFLAVFAVVFLITPVILSPVLFQKKNPPSAPGIVAADEKNPAPLQKNEANTASSTDPFPKSQAVNEMTSDQTSKPSPQQISGNAVPNRKPYFKPGKKPGIKGKKPFLNRPVVKNNQPVNGNVVQNVHSVSRAEKNPSNGKTGSSEGSRWGVAAVANLENGDAALTYRVATLSILNKTDVDILVGTKEAGVGLSKNINNKWGIGVTGTVSYDEGDKQLGVYVKYQF